MAKKTTAAARVADNRTYFVTYLLPGTFTDSELKPLKESVEALVKKHQGTITTTQDWGKKRLAYKIKHAGKWLTDGSYTHLVVEFPPASLLEFEKDLYLQPQIIRHLVVVAAKEQLDLGTKPAITSQEANSKE